MSLIHSTQASHRPCSASTSRPPDGATVIPVSKPVGVFVIKDGTPIWSPAADGTRIAMMGILVGLVSAAFAGIAMVRRPPWPDLHGDISRRD